MISYYIRPQFNSSKNQLANASILNLETNFFCLRYDGKTVADEKDLPEIINDGPKSKKFRDLIVWITDEIRALANIEEKVQFRHHRFHIVVSALLQFSQFVYDSGQRR